MSADEPLRVRAEALWEELGGDLCLCQQRDVPHWCERCQSRMDTIAAGFRLLVPPAPAPEAQRAAVLTEVCRIGGIVSALHGGRGVEDWARKIQASLDEIARLAVFQPPAALLALVRELQAHAREHGWQDCDAPIANLLAIDLEPAP